MKLDQIAYYVHNEEQANRIKQLYNLQNAEWVEDFVVGAVDVIRENGTVVSGQSRAHLRFCYSMGIEFELLTYLEGPHWHEEKSDFKAGIPFLSHLGFHMEEDEQMTIAFSLQPNLQHMVTLSHTNQYVVDRGRRYEYCIKKGLVGLPDQKFIWRIES